MPPILAQGTNQALLDTMVLCKALSDFRNGASGNSGDLSSALRWYEKTRRRKVTAVSWVTSRSRVSRSESVLRPAAMISDRFMHLGDDDVSAFGESPPDIRGDQPRPRPPRLSVADDHAHDSEGQSMSTTAKVPPAKLARVVEWIRHHLYRLHQRLTPAPAAMMEMILATWTSQAITVAAQLGVADALADGPLPIDELAARVGADAGRAAPAAAGADRPGHFPASPRRAL